MIRKRRDYESIGIPEVWFVEPGPFPQGVLACRRPAPDSLFTSTQPAVTDHLTSPLLDGFTARIADLYG